MNRLAKHLIAPVAALLLVTGCAAPASSAPSNPASLSGSASDQLMEQAMTADTLVVGTTSQIEAASRADYYFDVLSGTLSQLAPVRIDEKGEAAPLLTDYATDDLQSWTLTVREGMQWQDGTPVTAGDIRFTLEYLEQQEPGKHMERYQSVEVKDDRTLLLTLKAPDVNYLNNLTTLRIIPQHIYKDIPQIADATEQQATLGCGPYRFVSYDKAAGAITFAANADYPNAQQLRMQTVIIKTYGNADTMLLALKKGDIDMVWNYAGGIEPAAAADLAAYTDRKLTVTPTADSSLPAVLVFNNSAAPWDNKELRRAVYYALDYQKFGELFGSQYSAPGQAGFVRSGTVGYTPTAQNQRDLAKAGAALTAAGYSASNPPPALELTIRNDKPVYQRMGELVKANLAEIGIEVILKPLDVAQFRTVTEQQHTHQAMLSRFTAFGMSMGAGMASGYMDGLTGSSGQGQITDPAFAEIVARMTSAGSVEQYAAAAADCQRYYADNCSAIALYLDSYIQAYAADLSGFVTDGTFGLLNTETWFTLTRS